VQDIAGNPLIQYFDFDAFTTGFVADTGAPVVVGIEPADGATGVATNVEVTVAASEALDPGSVTTTTVTLRAEAGGAAVAGTLSLEDGNRRIRLVSTAPLAAGTRYTVGVEGLRDMAGNAQVGVAAATFTTGPGVDLVAPAVVETNPVHNATGVPRTVVVAVRFSESLNPFTVNGTTIRLLGPASQVVTATVTLDATGTLATVTPAASLAATSRYTLQLFSSLQDPAGNSLPFSSIAFTTGS
jgi:hypothetical protein